jgi:hypothetical protein
MPKDVVLRMLRELVARGARVVMIRVLITKVERVGITPCVILADGFAAVLISLNELNRYISGENIPLEYHDVRLNRSDFPVLQVEDVTKHRADSMAMKRWPCEVTAYKE